MRTLTRVLSLPLLSLPLAALPGDPVEPGDFFANALATGDFDGDGVVDLAIGVAGEDRTVVSLQGIFSYQDAGLVHVQFGAPVVGLEPGQGQVLRQHGKATPTAALASGNEFGAALASGDFDGDGYDDLAIGIPGQTISNRISAGAVQVMPGGPAGLIEKSSKIFSQDTLGVPDVSEAGDRFGSVLATGDVNGDGYDDLVVGVPDEDRENVKGAQDAGVLIVLYGSSAGLTADGASLHVQGFGLADAPEGNDRFGASLALADFDLDGMDDVAVGVPGERIVNSCDGAVHVLRGNAQGLVDTGSQFWHQDVAGIEGVCESGDQFGHALAAADLDGDGRPDLVIGVPYERVLGVSGGAVAVFFGAPGGLAAADNLLVHEGAPPLFDETESGDRFGWALAIVRLDPAYPPQVVVGVPGEDAPKADDSGAIARFGLTPSRWINTAGHMNAAQALYQTVALPDTGLGTVIVTPDLNGDGREDLVFGAPNFDVSAAKDAGAFIVHYIAVPFPELWYQSLL